MIGATLAALLSGPHVSSKGASPAAGEAGGKASFADMLERASTANAGKGEPSDDEGEASTGAQREALADVRWRGAAGERPPEDGDPRDADGSARLERAGQGRTAQANRPADPDAGHEPAEDGLPAAGADGKVAVTREGDDEKGAREDGAGDDQAGDGAAKAAGPAALVVMQAMQARTDAAVVGKGDRAVDTKLAGSGLSGQPSRMVRAREDASAEPAAREAGGTAVAASSEDAMSTDRIRTDRIRAAGPRAAATPTGGDTTPVASAAIGSASEMTAGNRDRAEVRPATAPRDATARADAAQSGDRVAPASKETAAVVQVQPAAPAPFPTSPPAEQIARSLVDDLRDMAATRLNLASTGTQSRVVKTMRLQLHPAELGVVNIRLQSVNGELRIEIQAKSEATGRLLRDDSDAIRSALRSAGITAADVSIQPHRTETGQGQTLQHRDGAGQQAGGQQGHGDLSNQSRQTHRDSSSGHAARQPSGGVDSGDGGAVGDDRVVI